MSVVSSVELPGFTREKRQPQQEPTTPGITQSSVGTTVTMKRSLELTKELMWKFDVEDVTRNNFRTHA